MILNRNTRLIDITIGDLLEFLKKEGSPASEPLPQTKRYVYGLSGLASLFGCSKRTAGVIKSSGKIDKAISQEGRKIITDAELALELIKNK